MQRDGTLRNFRTFATLVGLTQNAQHAVQGGAVSMCIDEAGRLHVATRPGAQVFIPQGPFPFAVLTLERHGPPLSYDLPF